MQPPQPVPQPILSQPLPQLPVPQTPLFQPQIYQPPLPVPPFSQFPLQQRLPPPFISNKSKKSKSVIIIGVVILVVGLLFAIGIGVGLYFLLRKKKTKNPFFGLVFDEDVNGKIPNASDMLSTGKKYIDEVTAYFGVSSLATKAQLDKAVTEDGFSNCFYGLVSDVSLKDTVFINPYYATEEDYNKATENGKNTPCSENKDDNIGKHTVISVKGGVSAQGFYMFVNDQTKIPNSGDKIEIAGTKYSAWAVFNDK